MKRFVAILLAVMLVVGLTACAAQEAASTWEDQYELGIRYLSEGNYKEAIIAFTAAIEIDPMRVEAYVARGDAYFQSGQPEKAESDYRKALELYDDDDDTAGKLVDALIQQGKLEEAAEILEDLIEKDPSNPDYYDKLADIYEQLEQPEKVQETLEKGVEQTGDQQLSDRLEEIAQEASGLPPVPDDGISREVVEMSSGDELMELSFAEGVENLEIRLGDGDYNVDSFFLYGAENVSIIGTGNTRLVSTYGTETIISMYDCDNILLYGLIMGHDLEPSMSCSTGVVELLSSKDIKIIGCDIYGCGLHGINASESRFVVENSIIRDCSMHGAMLYSSRGIFTNCTFSGNCYQYTSNPDFDLWGESCSVNLNSCVIQDNLGESKYKLADGAEFEESDTIETGNSWQ